MNDDDDDSSVVLEAYYHADVNMQISSYWISFQSAYYARFTQICGPGILLQVCEEEDCNPQEVTLK